MKNESIFAGERDKNARKKEAFMLYHEKGKNVQEIAPEFGVSTRTIWRWIEDVRREMRDGDKPLPRKHRRRASQYQPHVFEMIEALKRENLPRPATTIHRHLKDQLKDKCHSISTVRKHLAAKGLSRKDTTAPRKGYVKFERDTSNDLWQVDIAGVQTINPLGRVYLHGLLDDHSRYIVGAKYFKDEKAINSLVLLRQAFEEYGRPNEILADNGTQFRNALGSGENRYPRLLRMLDVKPIFARPNRPQTKGKLERWFGTIRSSFLPEARFTAAQDESFTLTKLNAKLDAWIEWYNNEKRHRSLPGRQPPASRYFSSEERIYRPLPEGIAWDKWLFVHVTRKVTKYNTISYKGVKVQRPPGHAGCKVDVYELGSSIDVYHLEDLITNHELPDGFSLLKCPPSQRRVPKSGMVGYGGAYYYINYHLAGKGVVVKEANGGRTVNFIIDGILVKSFDKKPSRKRKTR
ncbi:MAG: DDE-type integrase/transposase/recombinase [Promethearchaeota archaeon]